MQDDQDWQRGLGSSLVGGFLLLTAAVGLVFNVMVATAGRQLLNRTDARLHGVSTAILLAGVVAVTVVGFRLAGRGPLGRAGRALLLLAGLLWALFAIGQASILVPMW